MAVYSITYDLIKEKDYEKVINAIKSISGLWAKPTKSQWLVDTTMSEIEIRKYLQGYIDSDDIIFVCKIDMPNWSSSKVPSDVLDWLHAHKHSN
ncbi:hypothetical protein CDG61_09385 [Acinetobacter sp. WCHAc010052]|nr:hypothetical protein CDG61_09385 [Acinetobacter sp. WCHAc010052]